MKLLAKIYLTLIAILSFLHYPLALISPYGLKNNPFDLLFDFEFPHLLAASFLSISFILLALSHLNFKEKWLHASALAIFLLLLNGIIFSVPLYKIFETAAFFTVPLAIFLATKISGCTAILTYILTFLFTLNLLLCFILPQNYFIGIAGNQNWLAATLLTSAPFAFIALKKLPKKIFIISIITVTCLTFIILLRTSARAVIPAFIFFGFYLLFRYKSLKFNLIIWSSTVFISILIIIWQADLIKRGLAQDIRGPLYTDTLRLAASSPFLGVGIGNFQKDFPEFASLELKQKIHYSSVIEHPHNQFLLIAAENGFLIALFWLIFLFYLLRPNQQQESIFWQFSLISGIVMGCADKPLTESPSAIVFLISCGLLIPEKFVLSAPRNFPRLFSFPAAIFALAILVLGVYCTQINTLSRYYYWQGEVTRNQFTSANASSTLPKAFNYYLKSSQLDPSFIDPLYLAASISIQFFNNLNQDKTLLEKIPLLDPNYADFNLKIAQYYLKQANLLGAGEERTATEAEAEKYFLQNFELSPWNINRARHLVRFYLNTKNFDKAEEWILRTRKITRERLYTWYTYINRIDLKGDIEKWQNELLQNLSPSVNLTDGMKSDQGEDYLNTNIFEKTNFLRNYTQIPNAKLDQQFWSRQLQLWQQMNKVKIKSTSDILKFILSLEVKNTPHQFPLETIKNGNGNILSLAYLACSLNALLNHESVILHTENREIYCLLFNDRSAYIWNCHKGTLIEMNLIDFIKQQPLKGDFELYTPPEAFCLRHQVIADIVSTHPDIPLLCQSPTLLKIRLQRYLDANAKIRFSTNHIQLLDAAAREAK